MVDGVSEDKTIALAKKYAKKLQSLSVMTSKKRHVSIQRNLGAAKAVGTYLLFVDADTRFPKEFLAGIMFQVTKADADVFTCWCVPDSELKADKAITSLINFSLDAQILLQKPGALGALIGCRLKSFRQGSGFDANINFTEDYTFVKNLYKNGNKVLVFKEPQFVYSLRRFRKTGMISSVRTYSMLFMKRLIDMSITNIDYPMGGQAHEIVDEQAISFVQSIETKLGSVLTKPNLAKKMRHIINRYQDSQ